MIIDSKIYAGACACGREHPMDTKLSVVEAGCLKDLDAYIAQCGLSGFRTVIYDENTYHAAGMVEISADQQIVLDPENLHANEHGVQLVMDQLSEKADYLVAVGSGTVHDITRYCAYLRKIPFVSCPTAASVDGFCSSVAAMTWEGAKKTLTAVAPTLVVADLNVIAQAPIRLARSGFGDMIGKYIALTDWRIGHALTGEFYCSRIAELTEKATREVLECADGIVAGEVDAYEKLTGGLLLSGIAMQMMGNSRPASGAEHHISHCIEMEPEALGVHSDALHGEKVGVGTLLAVREYHRLAKLKAQNWHDYPGIPETEIDAVFGQRLSRQIREENARDAAAGIAGQQIRACWDRICAEIGKIPQEDALRSAYDRLGVKSTLRDIDVGEALEQQLLDISPMVRNRLTLMRLRRCLK